MSIDLFAAVSIDLFAIVSIDLFATVSINFLATVSIDLFATVSIDFLARVSIDATVPLLKCGCNSTVVTVHPFFFGLHKNKTKISNNLT